MKPIHKLKYRKSKSMQGTMEQPTFLIWGLLWGIQLSHMIILGQWFFSKERLHSVHKQLCTQYTQCNNMSAGWTMKLFLFEATIYNLSSNTKALKNCIHVHTFDVPSPLIYTLHNKTDLMQLQFPFLISIREENLANIGEKTPHCDNIIQFIVSIPTLW